MEINAGLILQFCGIILIIALIILSILSILVLLDIRFIINRLKKEIKAATFLIGIMDMLITGIEIAKKKLGDSNMIQKVKETINIFQGGD